MGRPKQRVERSLVPVVALAALLVAGCGGSTSRSALGAASGEASPEVLVSASPAAASGSTVLNDNESSVASQTPTPRQVQAQTDPAPQSVPCDQGGACQVGDRGPGGGIVVYASDRSYRWGRYIEAAPAGWSGSGDPVLIWCGRALGVSTNGGIGDGRVNTENFSDACPESPVINAVGGFAGGGLSDWYVPSVGELREVYRQRGALGLNGVYWSSSLNRGSMGSMIWNANMNQSVWTSLTSNPTVRGIRVRPVRSFDCQQCS